MGLQEMGSNPGKGASGCLRGPSRTICKRCSIAAWFTQSGVDQSPGKGIGGQETATVIFDSECPKVVDRFHWSMSKNDYLFTMCSANFCPYNEKRFKVSAV